MPGKPFSALISPGWPSTSSFRKRRGAGHGELTKRKREVLSLIAEGLSNKEIANNFGVGVRTVNMTPEEAPHAWP